MYYLWKQISEYCDDSDTIYFLGDAIDRGDAGLRILTELLRDKRVKMVRGNHEEFIIDYYLEHDSNTWLYNGGYATLNDFNLLSYDEMSVFCNKIIQLPLELIYTNPNGQKIIMNHAGFIRDEYDEVDLLLFKDRGTNPYTWDRRHFGHKWKLEENTFLVHGHTPVQALYDRLNKIYKFYDKPLLDNSKVEVVKYCDGHKIDIDLGCFASNKTALFNLDTLEVEKYFEIPSEGEA
jgi:hypothetical protein